MNKVASHIPSLVRINILSLLLRLLQGQSCSLLVVSLRLVRARWSHELQFRARSCSAFTVRSMSDIRVSVRWETPTVFAGENIECTITFRNVAIAPCHPQSATPIPEPRGLGLGRERYRSNLSVQHTNDQLHRSPASIAELPRPKNHGHRSTVSLNTHIGATPQLSSDVQKKTEEKVNSANTRHRRSVSIISIGADTSKRDEPYGNGHAPIPHRPTRRHGRASSLQVVPSTAGAAKTGPLSGTWPVIYESTVLNL